MWEEEEEGGQRNGYRDTSHPGRPPSAALPPLHLQGLTPVVLSSTLFTLPPPPRCVRPDQSSATVRCHYLTDGTVNFAFTMRRAEYFIPAGVLLKVGLLHPGKCTAQGRRSVLNSRSLLFRSHSSVTLRPPLRICSACSRPATVSCTTRSWRAQRPAAVTLPLYRSARSCCCSRPPGWG